MQSSYSMGTTDRDANPRLGEPSWEVARLFPTQGHWSEQEYLALGASRLVELREGFLEVLPAPTIFHQLVVQFLYSTLHAFAAPLRTGIVLLAPLPVRLSPGTFREPDIVYLRNERVRDLHGQPNGADLVMEVVSEGPENRRRDLEIKRREYAAAGIPEYWIVDPLEQRITVLVLDGQSYREHGVFDRQDVAISVALPGFSVAVEAVLSVGQTEPS